VSVPSSPPSSLPARPHHAVWPSRLPRELVVPATSLWFNLEVSARRFPDKASSIFFGRAHSFSALKARAEAVAGWLQSTELHLCSYHREDTPVNLTTKELGASRPKD